MEIRDNKHVMAIKQALLQVCGSQGWQVMKQLGDEVVQELKDKAINEDDEEKAETFRHDARGAAKFWAGWLRRIEIAKNLDNEATNDNFLEVVTD